MCAIIQSVITMFKILLVEDDADIREFILEYFINKKKNAFQVDVAADGQTGLEKAYENNYDLLLLDIMVPELDGFEICREIRRESDVPIVFITAKAAEDDMRSGYALGCDDYIIKPFKLSALYEKVNALIKRSKGLVRSKVLTLGTLSLNPNNGKVISNGKEIKLTSTEYSILKLMLENKGIIISREKIIDIVWGFNSGISDNALEVHIRNIRKALGNNAKLIKTAFKRGYIIEDK